jgi:predicted nucleic acid-binding protein
MGLRLYDSTFFVDLDREKRRSQHGPAHAFLNRHPQDELAMSVVTRGELARGFADRRRWDSFCDGFLILPLDNDVLWLAGRLFTALRSAGTSISDNDLWIGATALHHDLELITNNEAHFRCLPGLRVSDHRAIDPGSART